MKKIFLIIAFLLVFPKMNAQVLSFTKVLPFEGKSAEDLYHYSKNWIATTFRSPSKVIQIDDAEKYYISCSGAKEYSMGKLQYACYGGWINYTIIMQARDGRIKVEFTNFTHTNKAGNAQACNLGLLTTDDNQFSSAGMYAKYHKKVKSDILSKIEPFVESMFLSIETSIDNASSVESEDW